MTRIIHFADSHEEAVFPRGLDKRVLGYCNSHFKRRFQHKQELLDQAVRQIIAEKPDAVLFTGDAVSTADPAEFAAALPHFLPLSEAACIQDARELLLHLLLNIRSCEFLLNYSRPL